MTKAAEKQFLSPTSTRSGAAAASARSRARGTPTRASRVLDGDGIAGEVIFPDGITEMNMPPFGAGLSLPTESVVPELQWAGARAHNRWLVGVLAMAPERRAGVAIVPMLLGRRRGGARDPLGARARPRAAILIPSQWGKRAALPPPEVRPDLGGVRRRSACRSTSTRAPRRWRTTSADPPQPGQPDCPARWASTSPRWCGGTCGR